jgi:uncharacterized protein
MRRRAFLLMVSLGLPATGQAASFDCSKASTSVEKLICDTPVLGKLDEAMAQNFKSMLASNIGDGARNDLRATQKRWISERNSCSSVQCLEGAYRTRVDTICDYPVLSGVHPSCIYETEITIE